MDFDEQAEHLVSQKPSLQCCNRLEKMEEALLGSQIQSQFHAFRIRTIPFPGRHLNLIGRAWQLQRKGIYPAPSGPHSQRLKVLKAQSTHQEDNTNKDHKELVRSLLEALQSANKYIPQVAVASTLLALVHPPSFTWFTTKYYTPTLGYLMFAVGVNLSIEDFVHALEQPWPVALGYAGQYLVKPLLGVIFAYIAVTFLHLPEAIGSGLILVSCVSGAQLSNYATYLTEPSMTPLSIVMTALSTATAVFVTPTLTYFLLGKRLPVDVRGMMISILQVVIMPIALGQILNRFFGYLAKAIRPFLPALSVLATALCVGAPLATNINTVRSPFGLRLLIPILGIHAAAFFIGYKVSEVALKAAENPKALAKTISLETGMQSSLLGLALANKFFPDPLVGLPSAISVVAMTLMGFGLVEFWNKGKEAR